MNNFEKYNKLHNEVMKRLEDGEITVETAKEVIDASFEKYISEGFKLGSKSDLVFDKKRPESSTLGMKAFGIFNEIKKLEVDRENARKENSKNVDSIVTKINNDIHNLNQELESLPQDEYDAGKRLRDARFHRNRLTNRR